MFAIKRKSQMENPHFRHSAFLGKIGETLEMLAHNRNYVLSQWWLLDCNEILVVWQDPWHAKKWSDAVGTDLPHFKKHRPIVGKKRKPSNLRNWAGISWRQFLYFHSCLKLFSSRSNCISDVFLSAIIWA